MTQKEFIKKLSNFYDFGNECYEMIIKKLKKLPNQTAELNDEYADIMVYECGVLTEIKCSKIFLDKHSGTLCLQERGESQFFTDGCLAFPSMMYIELWSMFGETLQNG